ncbi:uncharacterized protein [Anas acuta]|uniref:uncharacterized protein isoform X1 n=1 Tax=Anas acuta TaxID=28680 RepID=UPI0035C88FBF
MNSAARNLIPAERIPCSQCSELVPDSARTCADPGPLLCQEIVFSCEMLQVLKTTQTALQEGVPKGVLSLPWWKKEGSGHFSGCPSAACGRVRVTEGAIAQRNDLKGAPLQLVGRLVVSGGLASGGAVADKLPREISPRSLNILGPALVSFPLHASEPVSTGWSMEGSGWLKAAMPLKVLGPADRSVVPADRLLCAGALEVPGAVHNSPFIRPTNAACKPRSLAQKRGRKRSPAPEFSRLH